MPLRPYQIQAKEQIRAHYERGERKVLLHLSTGGGKTTVFGDILKDVYNRGGRAIMVVRGRKLVQQACARLVRECVPHGVMMAKHWNYRPHERIQICSIDTLVARGPETWPQADLVVIDEAHQALSLGYVELARHYDALGSFFLPVTATPYVTESLRHIANVVVRPVSVVELIEQGYLVDARYYVPSTPDLRGVAVRAGDYVTNDLEKVMGQVKLVGDVVDNYRKIADGRRALYFCVSVPHSKQVAAAFSAQGVPAEHCDADTPEPEREAIIKRLVDGTTKVITNVGIFCTGVDIPPLEVVGMLRPTQSYNLYIQQAGRGTRPAPGKPHFLLIDHAGNVKRHGKITEEMPYSLDGRIKKFIPTLGTIMCPEHFTAFYRGEQCPVCAWQPAPETREQEIVVTEGELVPLENEPEEDYYFRQLERERKMRGYKRGWLYHKMKERFGDEIAQRKCPQRTFFWRPQ